MVAGGAKFLRIYYARVKKLWTLKTLLMQLLPETKADGSIHATHDMNA